MGYDEDKTHLEKVIDNEAMLTCEKSEASPKKETSTVMRYGLPRRDL